MKKQNGITLISLVITIIVLLILAGVSISLVVGQNGVLGKAQNAVSSTKTGTAREQVVMAWGSCETDYLAYGRGQEKSTYFTVAKLNENLSEGEVTAVSYGINASGDSEVAYKVDDTYYKMQITSAGVVTVVGEPTASAPTLTEPVTPPVAVTYLVDTVEVGDYVNINIDYENKQSFSSNSYVTATSALTGWRVLGKSGSGETGTVKLVSAGCPLTYYHANGDSSVSIPNLEDLNKELTIVASGTGFRANGFSASDLSTVFTSDKYIDTSKGIHALGCSTLYNTNSGTLATAYTPLNEIEEAYATITGTTKTMTELSNMPSPLGTTTLTSAVGANWKLNYTDLLANGQSYFLGGASISADALWRVNISGYVGRDNGTPSGVRPVVSLQSGVKLDSSNTGDGTSSNTAYTITK